MTSDLRALLAAIVADPADDTARLVYADCLQENGNPDRAQFIRLQIEAERLHVNSNARAALEQQARSLFDRHWRDWWHEVCTAAGIDWSPNSGYWRSGAGTGVTLPAPPSPPPYHAPDPTPRETVFRRGFPECVVTASLHVHGGDARTPLARWASVSPLAELTAVGFHNHDGWPEGPHLAGVRRLALVGCDPLHRSPAFRSPHLGNLEDLTLRPVHGDMERRERNRDYPAEVFAAPWAARLRALDVELQSEEEGERWLAADLLPQLETLRVDLSWVYAAADYPVVWLAALARSPRLANLRRLRVSARVPAEALAVLVRQPAWAGLRFLELDFLPGGSIDALVSADGLPELEELRLAHVRLTAEAVAALARSPLLKRLRHLALSGGYEDGRALLPLVDAVDPARIETFALAVPYFPERAAGALRAKFGDRVRFLPPRCLT